MCENIFKGLKRLSYSEMTRKITVTYVYFRSTKENRLTFTLLEVTYVCIFTKMFANFSFHFCLITCLHDFGGI